MERLKTKLNIANSELKELCINSHGDKETERPCQKRSVQEVFEFINAHGENGAMINGFLLWADIQRSMNSENIWKKQTLKGFVTYKITEGKETLWKV